MTHTHTRALTFNPQLVNVSFGVEVTETDAARQQHADGDRGDQQGVVVDVEAEVVQPRLHVGADLQRVHAAGGLSLPEVKEK